MALASCIGVSHLPWLHTAFSTLLPQVQELEALLREAREHGQHKDSQITKMQKDMEASQGAMARLQEQVSKLSEHLEKEKAAVQELQVSQKAHCPGPAQSP